MPLVFIVGTTCTLDAIFSLFVTATVASFYCAMDGYMKKKRLNCRGRKRTRKTRFCSSCSTTKNPTPRNNGKDSGRIASALL